ncbi:DUF1553 domain-containing protein [Rhodocytophaga aerolata]|uniref:DUF1553 domain-containing protein n=1 Tax=Rhodocytophaga aerolata TaxID=455078 RepID=A0ABT8RB03_9BACT|nr:DUF1553 domain-containing protein [Rhodocytophaga aerolata]MDO1449281.1 DUF1553 domain-containing protein [Rhodocytophaga aerolata]
MLGKYFYTSLSILLIAVTAYLSCTRQPSDSIDFNADIRPILNTKCISCHGGVKESAGFSLFSREDALRKTDSGKPAIIPGDPDNSEFMRRLTSQDTEERMPYHAQPLSTEEIAKLKEWIKQGAHWSKHWAYIAPQKPSVPADTSGKAINPIDNFIWAKLQQQGLTPMPEASKSVLLRRLSLDLTGLPPTEIEVQVFTNDTSSQAYEKQVDRLLASPHFGERWAAMWLDMARYSDTKGYEKDQYRNVWRYRDYVIKSFNEDKPFSEFTIEQLAGDLLPQPTEEQLIATTYHRNTANNDEGGTDDEEFRTAALLDRVSNTWEVWQGVTMSCVQCHSHPYDPIKHEEFYQSMAFFDNTRDEDVPSEAPTLVHFDPADELKITQLKDWVKQALPPTQQQQELDRMESLVRIGEPKIHPHTFDQLTNAALIDGKYLGGGHDGFARLKGIDLTGKTNLILNISTRNGGTLKIRKDRLDGEILAEYKVPQSVNGKRQPAQREIISIKQTSGKHDLYFVFQNSSLKNAQDYVFQIDWILFTDLPQTIDKAEYAKAKETLLQLLNANAEKTPVMQENPAEFRRRTHMFDRGNWLTKGKEVQPGTPEILPSFDSYPKNRLGLAQWLVSPENPLTARVTVNRFWEQLFGYGLVESMEDFGSQGTQPSHPELLDWLAMNFQRQQGWQVKKLLKLMVLSHTYRQSSVTSPELIEKDPANRLLARGPRFRLTAEQVRDQALSVGGLLSQKMYGKSVMPMQPEGVWKVVYSDMKWETSPGEDAFRRAIYTFWRRSSPYPSLLTFDAAGREICVSRRIRTNTPLQALVTLNDTVYLMAARGLAQKMQMAEEVPEKQIAAGYYSALFRQVPEAKLKLLTKFYHEADTFYKQNPHQVVSFLGKETYSTNRNPPQLAALTLVANAILNLDEFVMKE